MLEGAVGTQVAGLPVSLTQLPIASQVLDGAVGMQVARQPVSLTQPLKALCTMCF